MLTQLVYKSGLIHWFLQGAELYADGCSSPKQMNLNLVKTLNKAVIQICVSPTLFGCPRSISEKRADETDCNLEKTADFSGFEN